MKSHSTTEKLLTELQQDASAAALSAERLQLMADLRRAHPSDALLAAHLIRMAHGSWRDAFEWVNAMRKTLDTDLRLLAMVVGLEGKEAEQQTPTTRNHKE